MLDVAAWKKALSVGGLLEVHVREYEEDDAGWTLLGSTKLPDDSWGDIDALGAFELLVDEDAPVEHGALLLGMLHVPAAKHGTGLGALSIVGLAVEAKKIGCPAIRVIAEQIGSYACARWGFDFLNDKERDKTIERVQAQAQQLNLSASVHTALETASQPRDIAEIPGTIPWSQWTQGGGPPSIAGLPDDAPVKIGQALLLSPHVGPWEGILWLSSDDPGYNHLKGYVS